MTHTHSLTLPLSVNSRQRMLQGDSSSTGAWAGLPALECNSVWEEDGWVWVYLVFSHALLCAQTEDKAQRAAHLSIWCAAARWGRNSNLRYCPRISFTFFFFTLHGQLIKCASLPLRGCPHSVASPVPPSLPPSSPASTFVKWLPHPVGPEAVWSLIWSVESPETRRAPSGPGCAPHGSDPSHPEL